MQFSPGKTLRNARDETLATRIGEKKAAEQIIHLFVKFRKHIMCMVGGDRSF